MYFIVYFDVTYQEECQQHSYATCIPLKFPVKLEGVSHCSSASDAKHQHAQMSKLLLRKNIIKIFVFPRLQQFFFLIFQSTH